MAREDRSRHTAAQRRAAERQDRRECILSACRTVFAERGYRHATIRDIALAAELSPALIYHYYNGKEALYGAVCEEAFRVLLESLRQASQADGPAIGKLFSLARAYVRYYRDHRQYFDILSFQDLGFRRAGLNGPGLKAIEWLSYQAIEEVHRLVRDGMQEGSVRASDDSWSIAVGVWAALEGLISIDRRGYLESLQLGLDQQVEGLLIHLYQGLEPRASGAPVAAVLTASSQGEGPGRSSSRLPTDG